MEKLHIVITGRRNTGKSSLINAILGQDKAIVSAIAGTTTDPVKKSYEIPGIATIVFIDTAGVDDEGVLGKLRVDKTVETIRQADAAILVISENRFGSYEEELIATFRSLKHPFLIVHNQSDRMPLSLSLRQRLEKEYNVRIIDFSTYGQDRNLLIEAICSLLHKPQQNSLLGGLIHPGEMVMLITPIDSEAPTGRMILPQVQMLRDILDHHCISIVLQPEEIPAFFLHSPLRPDLVITDSQVFGKVSPMIPASIPLTSFSIVLAHQKGNFDQYLKGTRQIEKLNNGDRILMLESCSHHTSCEDIGRVKLPLLLKKYTGKQLEFDYIAGLDQIKRPFTDYAFIIQCGGCMVTAHQLQSRLQPAIDAHIPVSNYGMTIAYLTGIFERVIEPFKA
ncbi:MAG: [FeFe] hydrogenase H-cluster maturation GTPase HydF [Odoribacter sp.]